MAIRKAAGVLGAIAVLFALYLIVRQLPIGPWIVAGAKALHALGWRGPIAAFAAAHLLTVLPFPIIPLGIACGWLCGPWAAVLSLAAAVASAMTAFSIARGVAGGAAAQALLERPKARALAELAAEGGAVTVALIRISPILPFTPANAVLG